jgi:type II secretion system protein N
MTRRQIFFYLIYFFLAFALLSLVLFPREKAAQKLGAGLTRVFPGVTVEIKTARPAPVATLACPSAKITLDNGLAFYPKNLDICFAMGTLFQQAREMRISADLFAGKMAMAVHGLSFNQDRFDSLTLDLNDIHLTHMTYRSDLGTLDLTGSLSLQYQYPWYQYPEKPDAPRARGKMEIRNLDVQVKNSILNQMGISTLTFHPVSMEFLQDARGITVLRWTAKGDVLSLRLKGKVFPSTHYLFDSKENWLVDLKGFIQPMPGYIPKFAGVASMASLFRDNRKQGIPIHITGPLTAPRIKP